MQDRQIHQSLWEMLGYNEIDLSLNLQTIIPIIFYLLEAIIKSG